MKALQARPWETRTEPLGAHRLTGSGSQSMQQTLSNITANGFPSCVVIHLHAAGSVTTVQPELTMQRPGLAACAPWRPQSRCPIQVQAPTSTG